jgi:hypothetical protein
MPASSAAIPQHHTRLDHLVERHQPALEKTSANLLRAITAPEFTIERTEIERLIRAAFAAGLVAAYMANQFARPNGTPAQSQN